MGESRCRGCDDTLPAKSGAGRPRLWCSESCRVASYRSVASVALISCEVCGVVVPKLGDKPRRYCSPACSWRAFGDRRRLSQDFTCDGCGSSFSREPVRGQRPKWCDACRFARKHPPLVAKATRVLVSRRDAGICQLCGDPVDLTAAAGSDWSATVDHVVPWSQGGSHEADNLRLAHHWCNSVRSDGRHYSDADFQAAR